MKTDPNFTPSPRVSRRSFLRRGAALVTVAPLAQGPFAQLLFAQVAEPALAPQARVSSRFVPTMGIRDYLSREAQRITERALADYPDAAAWRRLQPEKRSQFIEMLGLGQWWSERREPPAVTVTGVVEREHYRIEKLYYECLPNLYATANLYVPKKLTGPAPAVLYVCGHALEQKTNYGPHARRFAELGFVCLLVETLQRGEVKGFHHGLYHEGWWHWYSRGYTSAGMETLIGVRAFDLLARRPDVDPARMGVTGHFRRRCAFLVDWCGGRAGEGGRACLCHGLAVFACA